MTERKSLATTGKRAALPEIAPESVANVRRTRMQNGVAKVLELSAQFSAVGRPYKKKIVVNLKRVLLERNWAPSERSAQPPRPASFAKPRADWPINAGAQAHGHKPSETSGEAQLISRGADKPISTGSAALQDQCIGFVPWITRALEVTVRPGARSCNASRRLWKPPTDRRSSAALAVLAG